jgi:hypothetical protein
MVEKVFPTFYPKKKTKMLWSSKNEKKGEIYMVFYREKITPS